MAGIFFFVPTKKIYAQSCDDEVVIEPMWCHAVVEGGLTVCRADWWGSNRVYSCDTSDPACPTNTNVCSSNDQATCESKDPAAGCDFAANECEPGYCGQSGGTCGGSAGICGSGCDPGYSCIWIGAANECRCRSTAAVDYNIGGSVYLDTNNDGSFSGSRLVNSSGVLCEGYNRNRLGACDASCSCNQMASDMGCDGPGEYADKCGSSSSCGERWTCYCQIYEACSDPGRGCTTIDGIRVIAQNGSTVIGNVGYPEDCSGRGGIPYYNHLTANRMHLQLPAGYTLVNARWSAQGGSAPDCSFDVATQEVICREYYRRYNGIDYLIALGGGPSCTLRPDNKSLVPGGTLDLAVSVSSVGGNVDTLTATLDSDAASIASVCVTSGASCPPGSASATDNTINPPDASVLKITGYAPGSGTYTVVGDMDDAGNTACTAQAGFDLEGEVTVSNTQAWWQVIGGDVVAGGALGNIQSLLPTLTTPCTTPTCERYLIRDNPLDSPGVPSAGSGTNYGSDGSASSQSWNAEGSAFLVSKVPDYEAFEARIPSGVTPYEITTSSIDGSTFETEVANYFGGYYWYKYTAPGTTFTINAPLDGVIDLNNRRVILFVDSADLTIGSKISATPGLGGIYIIADKDITFDPGTLAAPLVGHPETTADASTPDVYGLFYADGQIFTGSDGALPDDDLQLHVKGSLAGLGMDASGTLGINDGVVFQRKLSDNTDKPGEIIEFAPDLILSWPPYLSDKNITWREVAP